MSCESTTEAYEILRAVNEARKQFSGAPSKKYIGAATALGVGGLDDDHRRIGVELERFRGEASQSPRPQAGIL